MTSSTVLVTGGSARIGAAIVQVFARNGWHVVIHYGESHDEAETLAGTLPSAETVHCDLADGDAAVTMVEALAARLPDWRCLVNCAAIFEPDAVTELDPATNLRSMQINARTPARMAQAYLAHATLAGALLKEFGVSRMVECWGDDVREGTVTDFRGAVKAKDDEVVVFSWFEYPSKEVRDTAMHKMMNDPRMKDMTVDMPFDGKRMIFGGFVPILDL